MRTRTPLELAACLLVCSTAAAASGAERWLAGGLFDAELWDTDPSSVLLSRNEGEGATSGALRLWAGLQPLPQLELLALGAFEGGTAHEDSNVESELEQAYVRWSFAAGQRMFLEAGRIVTPIGDFPRRHLSPVNPLIGAPTAYEVDYPIGVQWAGSVSMLDFRVAVVDGPLGNTAYVPESDSAPRPALALGVTPIVGLRFGGYYTSGPYLNADLPLPDPDSGWRDFDQEIIGAELQFSRGHFALHADFNASTFEVPGYAGDFDGSVVYIEPRYTWSPRWFTALRVESNDYVYIEPDEYGWYATAVRVDDLEIGAGYRLGPETVLKASYRFDHWHVTAEQSAYLPDGHAFALQLSQRFDVRDWLDVPR